ncbi:MAG: hypothetical protein ABI577_01690 [bacterium]
MELAVVAGVAVGLDVELPATDGSELAAATLPVELPEGAASQPAVSIVMPAIAPVIASLVFV